MTLLHYVKRTRQLVGVARKRETDLARVLDVLRQRRAFPARDPFAATRALELERLARRAWFLALVEILYLCRCP